MPADHDRPAKRHRVTQACQRCRGRKFRCDGGSPSCGACLSAQATCSYDTTSGRQRGLKSGYVKVLESLWGSVFQNIPGSEHVVSHLLAGLPTNAEHAADEHPSGNDNTSPLERWRASSIPEGIRALLDGKALPTLDGPGVANATWNLPSTSGVDNIEQDDSHAPPLPLSPIRAPNLSPSAVTGLPELPSDWQTLVQVYLCTEYCCLPVFEKACPYRWAYKYQDHANTNIYDLRSSYRGQYASLWAILVLGELHLHGANSTRLGQMKQSAKIFLATAESSGPDQTFSYAFLLWSLVYTGSCAFILARMMLAQAIVLADAHEDREDAQADGAATLVQAGCYVAETILALATGCQMSSITVDVDTFPSGDVGEWDPFINALSRGNPNTASKTSPQLPPSRTGSTFEALIRLMAILRKTIDAYSNTEVLAADLQAWEASLAVDLRGAVTAEATASRIPVPSQLNLRSWYGTLCSMLATVRQDATGSTSNGISGDLALQRIGSLHMISREYGLGMLPATSSVLLLQASQLPAALHSPQDALSDPQDHLTTVFPGHWGWPNVHRGGQQDLPRPAAKSSHLTSIRRSVIPPSLTDDSMGITTGLEHQELVLGHSYHTADTAAGSTTQPALEPIGDVNETQPLSQWRLTNEASTLSVDNATTTNVDFCMEDPASYDLLEYLTMFENNNWYVGERRWFGPSPLSTRRLTTDTVMTENTWNLSGMLVVSITLHEDLVKLYHHCLGRDVKSCRYMNSCISIPAQSIAQPLQYISSINTVSI